jgi:hypothetical protein
LGHPSGGSLVHGHHVSLHRLRPRDDRSDEAASGQEQCLLDEAYRFLGLADEELAGRQVQGGGVEVGEGPTSV